MKDYTVAVNELRDHYNQLRVFKKSVRTQVKAEFEAKIDFEIQSRIESEELKFAKHLAAVKAREDMPVRIIQDNVLRTRTWSVWERVRDLAGLQPEFVRAEDVRENKRIEAELSNRVYEWRDGVLYVHRNPATGQALPHVLAYPLYNAKGAHVPYQYNELSALEWLTGNRKTGIDLAFAISDEIKRAFRDEELTVSTQPYDYVNDLDPELRDEYLSAEDNKFIAANPWLTDYEREKE